MRKFYLAFLLTIVTSPVWAVGTMIVMSYYGLAAAGAMTAGMVAAAAVINFAVSTLVTRIFAQKPPSQTDNGVRQQIPPATVNSIPVVYGDAWLGGVFVDAVLTVDQTTMIYTMAISNISPYGQFTFDQTQFYYGDRLVTFDATDGAKVVSLTDGAGNVDDKINGNLWIYLYTSDASGNITSQTNNPSMPWDVLSPSDTNIPAGLAWPTTGRRMNGLAFAMVKLIYSRDDDAVQLQSLTYKCSHYLNNEGCAKPGSVWYDYMVNEQYGAAMNATLVDADSAAALNDYADELITYTDNAGAPATQPRYRVNGVIDTGFSVLENVNHIMTACDSWMAYDNPNGRWSVIVNKAETAAFNFDDSTIIGDIRVSSIDINQSVNQIEVKFPNKLNKDVPDYVFLETPSILLYANEPVNKYSTSFSLVNDSVQTQYLANRVLEQARLDLIVSIKTTYNGIQVDAGDVVTITNSAYGWTDKPFRVMKVNEASLPDGSLGAALELNEYNEQVYDDKPITEFDLPGTSDIPSSAYFGPLSAPVVSASYPNASVPTFDVLVTSPSVGRVTGATLYYTTSATPATSDYKQLAAANTADGQVFPNSTGYTFADLVLPSGTYYFAFTVQNDVAASGLSPLSTAFAWAPVGQPGPTGPSGPTGPIGPTGTTGETGPRNAQVYFFYNNPQSTAPTAPTTAQVSYNFSTQTASISASGWSTTFNPGSLGVVSASNKYWAVKVVFQENSFGGSYSETISSVFTWENFDGLVTFTNLANGQNQSGTATTYIDGGTITTNTLNVSTIKSNTTSSYNNTTFGLGTATYVAGLQAGGQFLSTSASYAALIAGNTTNGIGLAAGSLTSSAVYAVGYWNGVTSSTGAWRHQALLGNGNGAAQFQSGGTNNIQTGSGILADMRIAYYLSGTTYAYYIYSGTGGPFTASHDGMQLLTEAIPEIGDIMIDASLIAAPSVNDAITSMVVSTTANQKGAIGVLSAVSTTSGFVPAALAEYITNPETKAEDVQLKPEFANIYDTYRHITVNSVGEGKINVCGQNGDIAIGDLIVASDTPGKGMKQADDIVRSYTVAKARENVTFASPTEVKMIACIYMAG